jgi:HlyD family secretion protein
MRLLYCIFFITSFVACKQVATTQPQRKNIVEAVYASGKIVANNEYYVYALGSGTIAKKLVKEGDMVKKGQVLFMINSSVPAARMEAAQSNYENIQNNLSSGSGLLNDLQLQVQSAGAKFENDSLQYVRLQALFEQGIGMRSAVDNAYTAYRVSRNQKRAAEEKYRSARNELKVSLQNARSQLVGADFELRNNSIRSESDGMVYQTLKEAGEAVRPTEIVALIGSANGRIIRLAVDQQDINKIKRGQEVLLRTDVSGNALYHAVVTQIYPTMNEADQTFRVDAQFKDSSSQLFIHSSVEANIIVQEKSGALIIPRTALLANDSVQVKEGRRIKTIAVQTGIRNLDEVEVVSGLNEASHIVLPAQK